MALPMFQARGFDKVGVADLCGAMGVTPTSLYAAYGNKLSLFERVLDAYVQRTGRFVADALSRSRSVEDVFREVLTAAAESYTSDPDRPGCMVLDGSLSTMDAAAARLIKAKVDATRRAVTTRLKELDAGDAQAAGEVILTLMRGLSAAARSGSSRAQLMQTVDLVSGAAMHHAPQG